MEEFDLSMTATCQETLTTTGSARVNHVRVPVEVHENVPEDGERNLLIWLNPVVSIKLLFKNVHLFKLLLLNFFDSSVLYSIWCRRPHKLTNALGKKSKWTQVEVERANIFLKHLYLPVCAYTGAVQKKYCTIIQNLKSSCGPIMRTFAIRSFKYSIFSDMDDYFIAPNPMKEASQEFSKPPARQTAKWLGEGIGLTIIYCPPNSSGCQGK